MRALLVIALIAMVGTAAAEEKPKVKITKEIDKATPILMSIHEDDGDPNEAPAAKAQDYNSSRSNTTSVMSTEKSAAPRTARPGKPSSPKGTRAQDYNSSRSNNINAANPDSTSTDYNSSRSNNINGAVDPDSDGDSVPTKVCTDGEDNDCN